VSSLDPSDSARTMGDRASRVAVALGDVARRLRELISALDRRAPRAGAVAEPGIARDAAALRQRAVNRLAEIADPTSAPDDPHRRVS